MTATMPGRTSWPGPRSERGTTLLLVALTSALLLTLAGTLLAAALAARDTAVLRADAAQAEWLARAALRETIDGLATGRVRLPSGDGSVLVDGVLPDPPPGMEPLPAGDMPAPAAPPGGGCGFRADVRAVKGPDGQPREVPFSGAPGHGRLVEVRGEGWCGRGYAVRRLRLVALPGVRVEVLAPPGVGAVW